MFEMLKKKQNQEETLYDKMVNMKGQATPVFGYYVLRDIILKEITGEYQSSILYWMGKRIAAEANIQSFERLREFFLDLGWGLLKETHRSGHMLRFVLHSPFFYLRDWKKNKESFALECGFLAEAISIMENKDTEGEFILKAEEKKELVEFIIYLQPKIPKAEAEALQKPEGHTSFLQPMSNLFSKASTDDTAEHEKKSTKHNDNQDKDS